MASNESRRYKRLVLQAKINGQLLPKGSAAISPNPCIVSFKDFSKSGAGVYTNTPFDLQTIVHLSINGVTLPPLEGRVVWCGPPGNDPDAPKGVQYRVGIDFMPKDDDARENQLATYQKMLEIAEGIARK